MHLYSTPNGPLEAKIKSRYIGSCGQRRICLIDKQGLIHHFNLHNIESGKIPQLQVSMLRESSD